ALQNRSHQVHFRLSVLAAQRLSRKRLPAAVPAVAVIGFSDSDPGKDGEVPGLESGVINARKNIEALHKLRGLERGFGAIEPLQSRLEVQVKIISEGRAERTQADRRGVAHDHAAPGESGLLAVHRQVEA